MFFKFSFALGTIFFQGTAIFMANPVTTHNLVEKTEIFGKFQRKLMISVIRVQLTKIPMEN